MNYMVNSFLCKYVCFLLCVLTGEAQVPDLTKGEQHKQYHDWTLGAIGARGWIHGYKTTELSRQILITQVFKGSPAHGLLQKGDVIIGINGNPISYDARRFMGDQLLKAERTGMLKLSIYRDKKGKQIDIPLKKISFNSRSPFSCKASKSILSDSLEHLANSSNKRYPIPRYMSALAMLASGEKKYLPKVQSIINDIPLSPKSYVYSTWFWGYTNLLLAEYYLLTKDKKVLPLLKKYSKFITYSQSDVGTWGHGESIPHGDENRNGRPNGYGAVNCAGLVCHLSLILASKAIEDEDLSSAIEKANNFLSYYAFKGSVPYGFHQPYLGSHDSNGKSSLAAIIFSLQGRGKEANYFGMLALAAHLEEGGHTGIYFANLWQNLGVYAGGGEAAFIEYFKKKSWYLSFSKNYKGNFPYQGQPGIQDKNVNWDMTPAITLSLCLPLKQLYITGKRDTQIEPLNKKDMEHILEYREINDRTSAYKYLQSPSPILRQKAATYLYPLLREEDIPTIKKWLNSKSLNKQKGALQLLMKKGKNNNLFKDDILKIIKTNTGTRLKTLSAQALQVINLNEEDLSSIIKLGSEAELECRDLSLISKVLFYGGRQGEKGIFQNGSKPKISSIQVLLKKLLLNDDSYSKTYIIDFLKKYSKDDLKGIFPEIIYSAENFSSAGMMYAGWVRIKSLQLLASCGESETLMATCIDFIEMRAKGSWYFHDAALVVLKEKKIKSNAQLKSCLDSLKVFLKKAAWKKQANKTLSLLFSYETSE